MVPKCMMGQGLEMHCGSNKLTRFQWDYPITMDFFMTIGLLT